MGHRARQQAEGPGDATVEQIAAVPSCVAEVRARCRARAAAAGADSDTVDAIAIAVSEAASNVVIHAYAGVDDGRLELETSVVGQELEIIIRDAGSGLGHAQSPGGLGQGLLMMDQLADSLRVTTAEGGGTCIAMRFRLP